MKRISLREKQFLFIIAWIEGFFFSHAWYYIFFYLTVMTISYKTFEYIEKKLKEKEDGKDLYNIVSKYKLPQYFDLKGDIEDYINVNKDTIKDKKL